MSDPADDVTPEEVEAVRQRVMERIRIARIDIQLWLDFLAQYDAMQEEPPMPSDFDVREALAEYAHEAWAGWMRHMLGIWNAGGGSFGTWDSYTAWWTRQMNTPYADLPEAEKDSDRAEADKMLALVRTVAKELQL